MALAQALVRVRAPDLARHTVATALRLRPLTGAQKLRLGDLAFRLGLFDAAFRLLAAGLRDCPADPPALRVMAALWADRGDKAIGHRCLTLAARRQPVSPPILHDRRKPTVARLRSVDNSTARIGYDPASRVHTSILSGGHFSTRHMLNKRCFNVYRVDLADGGPSDISFLSRCNVAINTISCAERSPAALHRLAALFERHPDLPVINPPANVLRTSRVDGFRRLGAIDGITFPRTVLFRNDGTPATVAADLERRGFGYPLIVRRPATHTGTSMVKMDDRRGLLCHLATLPENVSLYAIQYIDCRGTDGFHSKMRGFFIDGRFCPVARVSSDNWQIHSADRYRVMTDHASLRTDERAYLTDPVSYLGPDAMNALMRIHHAFELDFFGVDFTVDPQGRVVIFEANASMRHNFDHAGAFPYTRAPLRRVSRAFTAMVRARIGTNFR